MLNHPTAMLRSMQQRQPTTSHLAGMRKPAHTLGGFTLIETLVAVVVLAFALAGLLMLTISSLDTSSDARHLTAAGALAQQKLEELRGGGYAAAASGGSDSDYVWNESGANAAPHIFARSWTVVTNGSIKDVTVTVSWPHETGTAQVQLISRMTP